MWPSMHGGLRAIRRVSNVCHPVKPWAIKVEVSLLVLDTVLRIMHRGFPGGAVVENLPANAGDTGSSPGLGGSHMPRSN